MSGNDRCGCNARHNVEALIGLSVLRSSGRVNNRNHPWGRFSYPAPP